MQLSANFTLAEFQSVSDRPLTASEIESARYFATRLLEPLRRAMGFGICVTSFLREGDRKAHGRAEGVDFVACDRDPDKLERMFQWLATYAPGSFGQLIHERNHLHATRPGYNGQVGAVMREPFEGSYVLASIAPALGLGGGALLAIAILWWLWKR